MLKSVKLKICVTVLLIVSIIMFLTAQRDIREFEQRLIDLQKEKAILLSERISQGLTVLMLKNNWQDLQFFMEDIVKDSDELKGVRIFLPENGIIAASSEKKDIGEKTNENDMDILKQQEYKEAFLLAKGAQRYATKLTVIENQTACHRCHGSDKEILGVMGTDISIHGIDNTVRDFQKKRYTDAVIAFLITGIGIVSVVWILIDRPIKKMIYSIGRVEDGDLTARMEEGKNDEFGLMAKSFNTMVESLNLTKKQVEQYHLEQMQRAARLASLGEIVSGIAHEIKNPLAGISCAVQLIQSELQGDSSKKEITNEILNQIKRLDNIVKNLLNYASPKPLKFFPYNIGSILEKTFFLIYPEAKSHKVSIDTEIKDNVPDVLMDPDQMQQVFLNIMINAIQAMPAGGDLKISISTEDNRDNKYGIKSQIRSDKVLIISFEDTGTGIDQVYMENIFDPFFTRKTRGTGLGLSISQRIIQEHGGEITASSKAGKGSTFTVILPVIKESENTLKVDVA